VDPSLRRIAYRWNLLRVLLTGLVAATGLSILSVIPNGWLLLVVPIFTVGVVVTIFAVTQWDMVWIWVALFVQAFLFALGLSAVVFGFVGEVYVPILLLAFTMILVSEHALTTTSSYGAQFSNQRLLAVREFNAETLRVSLNHLYRRLARDTLILGAGFVMAVAVASLGTVGPGASILSDPSLYMVIASISLAALLMLKEE